MTKPFSEEELLRAIDAAISLDREARAKRTEMAELKKIMRTSRPASARFCHPSLLACSAKQAAAELGTSEITIRVHRGQIMRKMRAHSLAELVRMADKLGIR